MQHSPSPIRKRYITRLIGRCLILLAGLFFCFIRPEIYHILQGWRFFDGFSILHLLWLVWVFDMIEQLWPVGKHVALGRRSCSASVSAQFWSG